jgi:hypothetical protein
MFWSGSFYVTFLESCFVDHWFFLSLFYWPLYSRSNNSPQLAERMKIPTETENRRTGNTKVNKKGTKRINGLQNINTFQKIAIIFFKLNRKIRFLFLHYSYVNCTHSTVLCYCNICDFIFRCTGLLRVLFVIVLKNVKII